MNNEKGFTLVEVLAGIVIITIILISVAQIMIQSNKTAEANKNQLVVIHLADAMLERLKIENHVVKKAIPPSNTWDKDIEIELKNDSEDYSTITINNQDYSISAYLTPRTNTIKDLNIVNVRVLVQDEKGKRKSEIEGYVEI